MPRKTPMLANSSGIALIVALASFSGTAHAQSSAIDKQPEIALIDENGVDLRTGELSKSAFKTTIGDAENSTFVFTSLRAGSAAPTSTPFRGRITMITCNYNTSGYCSTTRLIEFNGYSKWFITSNSNADGETLSYDGNLTILTLRDGTRMRFDSTKAPPRNSNASQNEVARLIDITKPDGEKITYSNFVDLEPKYAYSNRGYSAILSETSNLNNGSSNSTVTLVNTSKVYCTDTGLCNTSQIKWPVSTQNITNSGSSTVETTKDQLGSVATHTFERPSGFINHVITGRDGRSYSFQHKIFQYFDMGQPYNFIPITQFTRDEKTTTYSYNVSQVTNMGVVAKYPNGDTKSARFSGRSVFVRNGSAPEEEANYFYAAKDPRDKGYGNSPLSSRLSYYVAPEKNRIDYTYDSRGNVLTMKVTPKPNSNQQILTSTASYPTTCVNSKTCNKPDYVVDVRGHRTDYQYSPDHGGVTLRIDPANRDGVRSQTRYEYELRSAKRINSAGQIEDWSPIWKLVRERTCRTAPTCVGTANERITSYEYDDNLLVSAITVASGDGSIVQSTAKRHDAIGNVTETDGPMPGSADTTRHFYDANRNIVGIIGPDPDGVGPLPMPATRYELDADGRTLNKQIGTATNQNESALAAMSIVRTIKSVYDNAGLQIEGRLLAKGATQQVSQFSYDSRSRLECTTVRMNSAIFSSLPASACTLGNPGPDGPDRVTKKSYNAMGQLSQIRKAVGTPLEQIYANYTYTENGKQEYVTDANGNRSRFIYDGLDRLFQWNFPDKAVKGVTSASDYEAYIYDGNGNRTYKRTRAGKEIRYEYDALNRLIFKDVPGTAQDVYYGYDLRGLQTYARLGSHSGQGITNGYDSLDRLRSSTVDLGGSPRKLSHEYDGNGNRIRLTFPDNQYFTYQYDGLGRMTTIRENDSTQIANFTYNTEGRQEGLGGGFNTNFVYDGIGRVASIRHDMAGSHRDVTFCMGVMSGGTCNSTYNAENQVLRRDMDNAAYAWNGHADVNRSYAVNGLNQYETAGSARFEYDANGNLITDGSNNYSYDDENRLLTASGAVSATMSWDPTGRLWQVSGSATTRFLYDGDELVGEYDGSGNLLRRYVHGKGNDDPVIWYEGSGLGDRRHLRADHQGSIVAIGDSAGGSIGANSYDPYGIPGTANTGRFQYTGQAWLPELGMYHYKARIYSPTIGRFLQTDPIGYDDQMNLYAYVTNDPLNRVDPAGLQDVYVYPGMIVVHQRFKNDTNGQFSNAEISSEAGRLSGTATDGTKVVVVASEDRSRPLVTIATNPLKDAYGLTGSTATTDRIGGSKIEMAPNEPGTYNVGHEIGHSIGAGDQYAGGVSAAGRILGSDVPGPSNIMKDSGSGVGANRQTVDEIKSHALENPSGAIRMCSMNALESKCN